jgi:hypothetical protein
LLVVSFSINLVLMGPSRLSHAFSIWELKDTTKNKSRDKIVKLNKW